MTTRRSEKPEQHLPLTLRPGRGQLRTGIQDSGRDHGQRTLPVAVLARGQDLAPPAHRPHHRSDVPVRTAAHDLHLREGRDAAHRAAANPSTPTPDLADENRGAGAAIGDRLAIHGKLTPPSSAHLNGGHRAVTWKYPAVETARPRLCCREGYAVLTGVLEGGDVGTSGSFRPTRAR